MRPGEQQTSERARHDGLGPVQNKQSDFAVEKCAVGEIVDPESIRQPFQRMQNLTWDEDMCCVLLRKCDSRGLVQNDHVETF